MKASELRIGNWIHFNGKDTTVSEIRTNELKEMGFVGSVSVKSFLTEKHYSYESPWLANCRPIPLTEEWLLKFGFEQTIWNNGAPREYHREITGPRVCLSLRFGELIHDPNGLFRVTIGAGPHMSGSMYEVEKPQYVHQIQNLYFALTGKELITQ